MKLKKALEIIEQAEKGYIVHFEIKKGSVLESDYFPDDDEPKIETEEEAWDLARRFAKSCPSNFVNIYVAHSNHKPVHGYQEDKLKEY